MAKMPRRRTRRVPYTKASPVTVRDAATGEPIGTQRAYTPAEMAAVVKGRTLRRRPTRRHAT